MKLTGYSRVLRLALRRDRFALPTWIVLLGVLAAFYYDQFAKLYPTEAARQTLVVAAKANPSWVALAGPLESNSIGALALWKSSINFVIVALVVAFTVIRHGRADEESGRRELLESASIGRRVHPLVAISIGAGASVAVGTVQIASLLAVGAPLGGSLLSGLALALIGVAFAFVAAICGELTASSRTARVMAGSVLGILFMVRAIGDLGADAGRTWMTWLSPFGWAINTQAFGANRWYALIPSVVLIVVLAPIAFAIDARRDVGSGVLAPRAGRAHARAYLRSPLSLAWRLQRGTLIAWSIFVVVCGEVVGSSLEALRKMLDSSPQFKEWLLRLGGSGAAADVYVSVIISVMAMFVAGYALQSSLRLHGEEDAGRAEPLLVASVPRLRWAASHLVVAWVGSAWLLLLLGLSIGASDMRNGVTGSGHIAAYVGASLVQLPAVLIVAVAAILLFGFVPRWSQLAWAVYALVIVVGVVLPEAFPNSRVADLSPFTHIPRLPGAAMSWQPVAWLTALAVAGLVIGLAGFRRRDLR